MQSMSLKHIPAFAQRRMFKEKYLKYLETYLYVEIRGTKRFISINLEDVGLLEASYEAIDQKLLFSRIGIIFRTKRSCQTVT
jgi:hypothetical protein